MKLNKEQLINIIKEELELEQQRSGPSMKDEFEEKLYRNLKESFGMLKQYEIDTDQHLSGYHEVIEDLVFKAMKHLEQQRAELRKPRTRGTGV
jgi:hypothetical protein